MSERHDIEQMLAAGDTLGALAALDRLIAARGADDSLYYLRGKAHYRAGRWQQAMEDYMEALRLNPASP
ncbi:MAG: tetratricopeptide repeat protein, partial [Bacteroidaceae bacterium]|nr:tetratricopeptide repeat protein [Bacteroidaceae bacterium]